MKTLYLLRHAKSSWDHPGLADFDRPVLSTGIKRTKKIIKFLNERDVSVDLIVSSPAIRTLETARMVADGIEYPVEKIVEEPSLYNAELNDFIEVITGTPDDVGSLMVVGHNFTITHVVHLFLGPVIDILPTSGLAGISFATKSWSDIRTVKPVKLFVVSPKML